jgi:RNA polymerase sigma-70 factor (ECF subfamily)
MKSIAANLLGNTADAEDAVQEAFLKMFRASAAFQGGSRLSTWAYRILVNACYDILRRRRRRAEQALDPVTPDAGFPASTPDAALRLALERSLSAIPERPRAVFVLCEIEGLSHREVSGILGIPEATSRGLLFDARRRLQRLLSPPEATA